MLSLCLVIQRSICIPPLGFCLRVIVNLKPLNLEKTTSIVLSVFLLIYALDDQLYVRHTGGSLEIFFFQNKINSEICIIMETPKLKFINFLKD